MDTFYKKDENFMPSHTQLGNSMPTDTLFCRPISDFDEIWQAWGSTEETNPHQVSAHFNHF